MRGLWFGCAWVVIAACAPLEEGAAEQSSPELGTQAQAIVGGATTSGDSEVFMLLQQYNTGQGGGCTATLIGTRTLLTAAHCVDPRIAGASSMQIWATNEANSFQASRSQLRRVVEVRMHPDWNPSRGLDGDIALALLDAAPRGVTPKAWNTAPIGSLAGRPIRAVGYGSTGGQSGAGLKRTVDLTFRQVLPRLIFLGDQVGKGVCHGDSGGPSFHTFTDGVERVVGVHSFTTSEACTDGADTRVDAFTGFINAWISEKEGPQCYIDGQCKTGCAPVDPDCSCKADGVCSPECPDPNNDPDCPRDCSANGVCATGTCPNPDPDCVAEGETCTQATQCVSRVCVNDPQHAEKYCSQSCTGPADCPSHMECSTGGVCQFPQLPEADLGEACDLEGTFCVGNTVCTAAGGEPTVCSLPCTKLADCPGDATCELGQHGLRFCKSVVPDPIVLEAANAGGPAAASCAAAGGLTPWLALLWWARRRRPRAA